MKENHALRWYWALGLRDYSPKYRVAGQSILHLGVFTAYLRQREHGSSS